MVLKLFITIIIAIRDFYGKRQKFQTSNLCSFGLNLVFCLLKDGILAGIHRHYIT